MLDGLGPAQHKLVNNLRANFRNRSYFFVMGVTDMLLKTLWLFPMIYSFSSYLDLLLSLDESVLSAAVSVDRYLFLLTLAILEQSLVTYFISRRYCFVILV